MNHLSLISQLWTSTQFIRSPYLQSQNLRKMPEMFITDDDDDNYTKGVFIAAWHIAAVRNSEALIHQSLSMCVSMACLFELIKHIQLWQSQNLFWNCEWIYFANCCHYFYFHLWSTLWHKSWSHHSIFWKRYFFALGVTCVVYTQKKWFLSQCTSCHWYVRKVFLPTHYCMIFLIVWDNYFHP